MLCERDSPLVFFSLRLFYSFSFCTDIESCAIYLSICSSSICALWEFVCAHCALCGVNTLVCAHVRRGKQLNTTICFDLFESMYEIACFQSYGWRSAGRLWWVNDICMCPMHIARCMTDRSIAANRHGSSTPCLLKIVCDANNMDNFNMHRPPNTEHTGKKMRERTRARSRSALHKHNKFRNSLLLCAALAARSMLVDVCVFVSIRIPYLVAAVNYFAFNRFSFLNKVPFLPFPVTLLASPSPSFSHLSLAHYYFRSFSSPRCRLMPE